MRHLANVLQQACTVLKLVNGSWDVSGWRLADRLVTAACQFTLQSLHLTGFAAPGSCEASFSTPAKGNRAARRQAERAQKKMKKKQDSRQAEAEVEAAGPPRTVCQFAVVTPGKFTCQHCTWEAADASSEPGTACSGVTFMAVDVHGSGALAVLQQCEFSGYTRLGAALEGATMEVQTC